MCKAGVLAVDGEQVASKVFLPAAAQARHDGVRFVFVAVGIGQGLVFFNRQFSGQGFPEHVGLVIQPRFTVEVDVAGDVGTVVEIAVVVVVGNLVEIHPAAEARTETVVVFPCGLIAVVVFAAFVGRHPNPVYRALIIRLEITEFAAQTDAARADDARTDRCIVIRREIEIIRNIDFRAVGADFQGRHQKAALAVAIEREIHPRGIQHGHAVKDQLGMFGHADTFRIVGIDAVGTDVPRGIVFLTSVELGFGQRVAVFILQPRFFAHGLQTAAFAFGFKPYLGRAAAAAGQVVIQRRTAHLRFAVVQNKALVGLYRIGFLVVRHMFRIDGLLVALDDDAAFGLHADIGLPAQGIGGDAGVIDGQPGFAAALQRRFRLGGRLNLAVGARRTGTAQRQRFRRRARRNRHADRQGQRFD